MREGFGILLRVLQSGHAAHRARALALNSATQPQHGELLDAALADGRRNAALKQDEIELMLQVNGRLRGRVRVPADAIAFRRSRSHRTRKRSLSTSMTGDAPVKPKKVIVVPGRLVNVVLPQ